MLASLHLLVSADSGDWSKACEERTKAQAEYVEQREKARARAKATEEGANFSRRVEVVTAPSDRRDYRPW